MFAIILRNGKENEYLVEARCRYINLEEGSNPDVKLAGFCLETLL